MAILESTMKKHGAARKEQRVVLAGTAIVAVSLSCFMLLMRSRETPMDPLPRDFTPPPNWRLTVSRAYRPGDDEFYWEGPRHYARFESPLKPASTFLQLSKCFRPVDLPQDGWYCKSRPIRMMDLKGYPEWICRYLLHRRPIKGMIYVSFRHLGGAEELICYVWPNGRTSVLEVIYDADMP